MIHVATLVDEPPVNGHRRVALGEVTLCGLLAAGLTLRGAFHPDGRYYQERYAAGEPDCPSCLKELAVRMAPENRAAAP